jgi:hypothetical protein
MTTFIADAYAAAVRRVDPNLGSLAANPLAPKPGSFIVALFDVRWLEGAMSRTLNKVIRTIDLAKPKLKKIARELDLAKRKSSAKKRKTRKSK